MIPYISEFLGTFVLVFAAGSCAVTGDASWTPMVTAAVVVALLYAMAPVSNLPGSFNPAVSVALCLSGRLKATTALAHAVLQLLAGLLAGLCYTSLLGRSAVLGPREGRGAEACGLEALYTAVLCLVVLCQGGHREDREDREDRSQALGLAAGLALLAGGAARDVSGASLNPALSLGLDWTGYDASLRWGPLYALSELLGGALAAVLFRSLSASLGARVRAEFLGTFVLALTFVVAGPACAACCLGALSYALAPFTGAHLNPAVSLSVAICGRGLIRPSEAALYAVSQLSAGLLAGLCGSRLRSPPPPSAEYTWSMILFSELLFTALLCFVVLSVSTARPLPSRTKHNFYFALAISSCMACGGLAVGAVSGGAFNPAVTLALSAAAAAASASPFTSCLRLGAAELCGSALAAVVFALVRPEEFLRTKREVVDV